MEKLYEIKETIHRAIDKSDTLKSGELKMGELEFLNLATDTIKNIDKICALEEQGGYSEAGDYEGGSYGGGSYANRGKHFVRGHYSREGGSYNGGGQGDYSSRRGGGSRGGRGGYSREDGRSEMMERMEMYLNSATEEEIENAKRFMRQLENA